MLLALRIQCPHKGPCWWAGRGCCLQPTLPQDRPLQKCRLEGSISGARHTMSEPPDQDPPPSHPATPARVSHTVYVAPGSGFSLGL